MSAMVIGGGASNCAIGATHAGAGLSAEQRIDDLVTEAQLRRLLSRYAVSRPVARVIAEHAFAAGHSE